MTHNEDALQQEVERIMVALADDPEKQQEFANALGMTLAELQDLAQRIRADHKKRNH